MFFHTRILVVVASFSLVLAVAVVLATGVGPRSSVLATAAEPAVGNAVGAGQREYVTREEVRQVCEQLRIRDWSQLKSPKVEESEAKAIMAALKIDGLKVSVATFRGGLTVELEHGLKFPDTNLTNNHPLLTGKIVAAHLKEFAEYYQRLELLEVEGDLHKAVVAGETSELPDLYRKLAQARLDLAQVELQQLTK